MLFADVDRGVLEPVTPWDDEVWRASAVSWVREELSALGLKAGERGWRVRLRRWSVTVRVPLVGADEPVWFKANPGKSRFEPAVTALLARHRPDDVVGQLALDAERGWSLLAHGGEVLRSAPDVSLADWERAARQYSEFQRAVAPLTETLAGLGVPRVRDYSAGAIDRLEGLQPGYAEARAELEAMGMPDGLDHADLHSGQILGPDAAGRFRFFDWGDASVRHPFASMLVATRFVRRAFGEDAVPRLHDAYLDAWTDLGPSRAELRRALTLACRTAAVERVLIWGRVFEGNDGDGTADWAAELAEAGDFS